VTNNETTATTAGFAHGRRDAHPAFFGVALGLFALCFLAPIGFSVLAIDGVASRGAAHSGRMFDVLVIYDAVFAAFLGVAVLLQQRRQSELAFASSLACIVTMLMIPQFF